MTAAALLVVQLALGGPQSPGSVQPSAATASGTTVSGVVRDGSGRAVSGATVILRLASGAERQVVTSTDGAFSLPDPSSGAATLIVRAGGFAEARRSIAGSEPAASVEVVLAPAGVAETVTVTPTRNEQRLGDVPASVSVLGREEIRQSPAVVADDVLRQMPTFSLFRRTSSLSSHPTAQGVSLRGIGPSGVSRTLVLLDGVPFNDPFGGWVYWTRVPLESVDRIEVVDNSSSSLYGNYAMGGVINIVTDAAGPAHGRSQVRSTATSTARRSICSASDVWGKLGVDRRRQRFDTDGFPIVAPAERGPVDNNADGRLQQRQRQGSSTRRPIASRPFVRAGYFREDRDNGKVSTIDGTTKPTTRLDDGQRRRRACGCRTRATLQARSSATSRRSAATSSRCPPPRPPRSIGRHDARTSACRPTASAAWPVVARRRPQQVLHRRRRLALGRRRQPGGRRSTRRDRHARCTLQRVSGGTQRSAGVFVQDCCTPAAGLMVTLSARVDSWQQLRRPQPRDQRAQRHADGEQPADRCPTATTPSSARASPRCITSPTGSACGAPSAPASARRR